LILIRAQKFADFCVAIMDAQKKGSGNKPQKRGTRRYVDQAAILAALGSHGVVLTPNGVVPANAS
jgi:hypothetical protein